MKNTPLTVTFHIGGKQVDKLSAEQSERMAERLTEVMSVYYTTHPEEYKRIKSTKEKPPVGVRVRVGGR